ncbi:MAG: aldehyde ferredoxin oxidoreductase N-terminal domain-containing protein [Acidobacteriota bacterium]
MKKDLFRIAYIDLSTYTFEIKDRSDLASFVGGSGLALALFAEEVLPEAEPLAPEQPIIFANGQFSSRFPSASQVAAVFRSPLTGYLGESFAGGNLATAMFLAGFDAIVIKGRSPRPAMISIGPRIIHIRKMDPLHGTGTEEAYRQLYDLEPSLGFRSLVLTGQAGERTVAFAGLNADRYWNFGSGAGAVFGSKNLKALVVYGDLSPAIPEPIVADYRKIFENIHNRMVHSELMPRLHTLGTVHTLERIHASGSLPTRNMTEANYEFAQEFTAESLARQHLARQVSCTGCPIGCIHIAHHRRMFGSDSLEYEESHLAYDFDAVLAFGPMLGTKTADDLFALLEKSVSYGLDPAHTGITLAWLTEAFQNSLISSADIGTPVDFGYVEGYLQVLDGIVGQPNDFYKALARGLAYAAAKYGGQEYALQIGAVPFEGVSRYTTLLMQLAGVHHNQSPTASSHRSIDPPPARKVANDAIDAGALAMIMDSLGICYLTRDLYDMKTVSRALRAIGSKASQSHLWHKAYELFIFREIINRELGFNAQNVDPPLRLFTSPASSEYLNRDSWAEITKTWQDRMDTMIERSGITIG